MVHLDLFSGIGGFSLAARRSFEDHKVHCFVEKDAFCQKVLRKHWPEVPIHGDIKNYEHDGTKIDLITGGFPCQPFSTAGKRRGGQDDRSIWPYMLKIIKETRPYWVVCENVNGFINMGLDQTIFDMEKSGYSSQAFIIPACGIGAEHERRRIWIVSHADSNRKSSNTIHAKEKLKMENKPTGMGREVNGIPGRMDKRKRLKVLGNSIVPQIAEVLFKTIKHTGYQAGQIHEKDVKK